MRDKWDHSWETVKYDRELFRLGVRPGKSAGVLYTNLIRYYGCVVKQDHILISILQRWKGA